MNTLTGEQITVLRVALDFDERSDDLERLCTVLLITRGSHDYLGGATVGDVLKPEGDC